MSLVIDSSITLAWYFEDEAAEACDAVLHQVTREGAFVPPLWRFEVANGLQMAVRRRRVDPSFRNRALMHLTTLEIVTDVDSGAYAWTASVQFADRHALTVYDAAYLDGVGTAPPPQPGHARHSFDTRRSRRIGDGDRE